MLEGSLLFHDLCEQNPKRFSPGKLLNLHQEVERAMRLRLRQKGGPVLKPIDAHVFPKEEYARIFAARTGCNPAEVDLDRYGSFAYTAMKDRVLRWQIFHSADALKKANEEKGIAAGRTMVHEIGGTLYGGLVESHLQGDGVANDDQGVNLNRISDWQEEMILANEGWACFLSRMPFDTLGLFSIERRFLEGDRHPSVTAGVANRHFFVALALAKTEVAWGFDEMARTLMHTPPGEPGGGPVNGVIWPAFDPVRSNQQRS
ncbi:MAG: hypothetical protein NT099_04115 [Candidatus Saganbacteria bacterium]|nr:hypothetical protein [Candidatus Saganbacteria bacterium]